MSQALRRLARTAREEPRAQVTSSAHRRTEEVDYAAGRRREKGASAGGAGGTAQADAANRDANLRALPARVKARHYRPPPGRRVYSRKEDGQPRPRGGPALEDTWVQGAVRRGRDPIYEQAFLPGSLGVRPGRRPPQALATRQQALARPEGNHGLDIDIQGVLDAASYGSPFHERVWKKPDSGSMTLIRNPFRLP